MAERILVADVGLDSRIAGSEAVYTYRAVGSVSVGAAHSVQLGPRRSVGYVVAVREVAVSELGFPEAQLRDLGPLIEGTSLPSQTIATIEEVARQTLTTVPVCLSLATPPGIRDRLVTEFVLTGAAAGEELSTAQRETLDVLRTGRVVESRKQPLPQGTKSTLRALVKRGLVAQALTIAPSTDRSKGGGSFRLSPDQTLVERFLKSEGKKKPGQAVTVMRLQGSESASFSSHEIRAIGQVSEATVKALVASGLLIPSEVEVGESKSAPEPNDAQSTAIHEIGEAVLSRQAETFLLYGVTGAGKTEVYLRCAEAALGQGRQVLYLVPEIALTAQVIAQLRARFGRRVAVLHSNLSPSERTDNWMRIRSGEAPVVLGPRSAMFAPFTNLGLVVMDEEHEASYKQESTPRYHSKRIAAFLSKVFGCPLVLGSATPSIETFFEAGSGAVRRLDLPARAVAKARLPEVIVEDLREAYKDRLASVFSPRLATEMNETLARGEQAIVFLNRRAFAPFVTCRDCGHRFLCPHCAVSLALHRREGKLKCHHCDYSERLPETCPACAGNKVSAFGVGAEKVEMAVGEQFPLAKVARLDRDVARKKGALEEVLAKFRTGDLNVLVGTQMVAKGLDFPNVTLVGVVAADISLNIPDFRASERTFQLLSQVAGRAGRGERPGRVVIQTLSPGHVAVECARSHDYETFYGVLIEERRAAMYPPFVRMLNVLVTGKDRDAVYEVSAVAAQRLRVQLEGVEVLGPANCAIERVRDQWRRHIVLKAEPDYDFATVKPLLEGLSDKSARVTIDVDPFNLV